MTQEELAIQNAKIQQESVFKQFEQNCRIKAIDVAKYGGEKTIETILADADKIYKWLINK